LNTQRSKTLLKILKKDMGR